MLFCLKKELNSDTCYNIDEPCRYCATGHKTHTHIHTMTNTVWFHLAAVPTIVKFTERRRTVLGKGTGFRELVFNGYRGSVWEKQKLSEMNYGDGHQQCECT